MHRLAAAFATVLLLLGGTACGGGSEESSSTEPSESLDTGAPEEEDTDAEEEADNSGGDAVAVELPGLPIGGTPVVVSETLQCVDVGWTEPPDLPDWIGITVTGVAFTPARGFTQSSEPCPDGTPPCLAAGFQLTGDTRCHVAVAWTGEPTLKARRFMTFTSGVINCPPDRVEECEAFRDEVETEGSQSIGLDPHPSEFETNPDGTDDTDETDETDEAEPESTEESGPDSTDDGGG
jgi:hypothetical protein